MATYSRSDLRQRINSGIKGKFGILIDGDETMNDAVRQVVSDLDLRSTKRKTQLSPNLFQNVFEYVKPSDMKEMALIDLIPQAYRSKGKTEYQLTPFTEFYNRNFDNLIAIQDHDFIGRILVDAKVSDKSLTLSTLDSTTAGGGTWEAVGDTTNIRKDTDNYIKGNGSVRFDIGSGATTTAGIKNTSLDSTDITDDYLGGNGSLFTWVYINSTTDINSFTMQIGSSESDYSEKTVTQTSNNTEFVTGWNLLRFDLTNLTETGTPDNEAITFVSVFMNKETSKVDETDYRFDHIVLKKGEITDLYYYTKFGWQNASGTYKENATLDTDLLNADTEEYALFIQKGIELAGADVDEFNAAEFAFQKYENMRREYELNYPSERMMISYDYASF